MLRMFCMWCLLLVPIQVVSHPNTFTGGGARGYLPRGHIEIILRFLKQCVYTLSRGYMLDSFEMYPPL